MDNQVVKMLGIDQGTIFVFTSGLQIDLWTELRVKKWSKNTFLGVWTRFWTLNLPEKSEESSSRVHISELARSYGKRSKLALQKFLWDFQFFGVFAGFETYCRVSAPAGPKNGPKTLKKAKKRVLVITLPRGGVTCQSTHLSDVPRGSLTVLEGSQTPTERF